MRCHAMAGDVPAALRQYQACRRLAGPRARPGALRRDRGAAAADPRRAADARAADPAARGRARDRRARPAPCAGGGRGAARRQRRRDRHCDRGRPCVGAPRGAGAQALAVGRGSRAATAGRPGRSVAASGRSGLQSQRGAVPGGGPDAVLGPAKGGPLGSRSLGRALRPPARRGDFRRRRRAGGIARTPARSRARARRDHARGTQAGRGAGCLRLRPARDPAALQAHAGIVRRGRSYAPGRPGRRPARLAGLRLESVLVRSQHRPGLGARPGRGTGRAVIPRPPRHRARPQERSRVGGGRPYRVVREPRLRAGARLS